MLYLCIICFIISFIMMTLKNINIVKSKKVHTLFEYLSYFFMMITIIYVLLC